MAPRNAHRETARDDLLVVAIAEPGGAVLTGDPDDLEALAAYSDGVMIERA